MSKIAEKLSGFLQRRFVTKLVNFVFECALNAILLQLFSILTINQILTAHKSKYARYCIWNVSFFVLMKIQSQFSLLQIGGASEDPEIPNLMKTLSLFFWWQHFHFFLMKTLSLFLMKTFSLFFLMVHFSYTFFMVELSHFWREKLRFHVFFIGSLSIMGQFCDNTFS